MSTKDKNSECKMRRLGLVSLIALTAGLCGGAPIASAQTPPGPGSAAPIEQKPSEAPKGYWDTFKIGGHLEVGATFNPRQPDDGVNFGHLFTDRSNRALLNQFAITAERPIDPKSSSFDVGFKVQAFYGSDARYTHYLGILDTDVSDTNQIDIVEANIVSHLPVLTEGGIDVKAGLYPTPIGTEVIDPKGNFLYSHSYIFNYGIPLKHTGILTTTHVTDMLDVYLSVDSGVNTTLGGGDNNGSPAFLGGLGLNLLDGKLTILGLTHIGPELPSNTSPLGAFGFNVNHSIRFINDVVVTAKLWEDLTLITELNYIQDNLSPNASGAAGSRGLKAWGIAQYGVYNLTERLALVARAELFNDISGNVVASFPGNRDFVNAEYGRFTELDPRGRVSGANLAAGIGGRHTLYGALTLGVNYKPPVPERLEGLVIRPEVRFDQALTSTKPFDGRLTSTGGTAGTSNRQLTFGVDIVVPFSLF
jgi:hypothetical protein